MQGVRPLRYGTRAAVGPRGFVVLPAGPAATFVAIVLVLSGLALWPLAPETHLPAAAPVDGGIGAPVPPVLHAGGTLLPTAVGTSPDPAPPTKLTRTPRAGAAAASAGPAPVPVVRKVVQALFGRRNLEGG